MPDPLGLIDNSNIAPLKARAPAAARAEQTDGPNFKDLLLSNIEQVNRLQEDAQHAIEDFASGRRDLDAVANAQMKADIAFQMLLQVRNKLMDAYEEVKQIRV